jgi:transposase InsO family protein
MCRANPLWGAPRIHGELLKLGLEISETRVAKYMIKHREPPSQTWRSFLRNHAKDLVAVDFFTMPTATFRILFVLVVLHHDRRRILHVNVTAHPTAIWTARQLLEVCGCEKAPQYLLRDRDSIYGQRFQRQTHALGMTEVLTAPRSPWQNPYAERVIGSIRRECMNHVIVLGERHLRRILNSYIAYYNKTRTHLSLDKDAPEVRPIYPPGHGKVVELKRVGGLHHEYVRRAA